MQNNSNEVTMVVKKTTELSEEEIYQINDLFNKTFQKDQKEEVTLTKKLVKFLYVFMEGLISDVLMEKKLNCLN